jgi:hypothetical protein
MDSVSKHVLTAIRALSRVKNTESDALRRDWLERLPSILQRLNEVDRVSGSAYYALFLSRHDEFLQDAKVEIERVRQRLYALGPDDKIDTLIIIAAACYHRGDTGESLQANREAVATAEVCGNTREVARSMNNLGLILLHLYDPEVEAIFDPLRLAVEQTGAWRFSQVSHWMPAFFYALKGDAKLSRDALGLQRGALLRRHSQQSRLHHIKNRCQNLLYILEERYDELISSYLEHPLISTAGGCL